MLTIIVAAGRDGAIGRRGSLIWRIPDDLRRFKRLTTGHPVIMGRKTWESLPKRPLPGRLNIVVSRNPGYDAPGAVVVTSPQEALKAAGDAGPFVMGGEQIYRIFMSLADRIELTEVDDTCRDADAFVDLPAMGGWSVAEETERFTDPEGLSWRYVTLQRNAQENPDTPQCQ